MRDRKLFIFLTAIMVLTIDLLGTGLVYLTLQKYIGIDVANDMTLNFALLFPLVLTPLALLMVFLGSRVIGQIELSRFVKDFTHQARLASIGQMLSGIAHEINNPLAVIMARMDFMLEQIRLNKYDSKKFEEGISKNRETIKRISKIIHGMRALSRNDKEDPFELTSVKRIVDLTFDICGESLKLRNVDLRVSDYDEMLQLDCRAIQLSQVLLNLINNANDAIKDLKEDKWIKIGIQTSDSKIVFRVLNGGPKISEDISRHLFDPFFTTKAVGQGSGMGLIISQKIIENHQGKIYVDTEGEKTCFVVQLPLKQKVEIKEAA